MKLTKEELKAYIKLHNKVSKWFTDVVTKLAIQYEDYEDYAEDEQEPLTNELQNIIKSGSFDSENRGEFSELLYNAIDDINENSVTFRVTNKVIKVDAPNQGISFDLPIEYLK